MIPGDLDLSGGEVTIIGSSRDSGVPHSVINYDYLRNLTGSGSKSHLGTCAAVHLLEKNSSPQSKLSEFNRALVRVAGDKKCA